MSSWKRLLKRSIWIVGPLLIILVIVACQPIQPAPAAQSNPAPTATAVASSASVTTTTATTATTPTTATTATTATTPTTSTAATTSTAEMKGDPKAGAYVVVLDFGCGCHLNRDLGGLAGGNTFTVTDGFVYARNITPDKDTGIGNWTPDQIANALLTGAVERDGKTIQLHPTMPYKALSVLSKQEALDVAAFLLSQKPIANQVKPRDLKSDPAPFTPAQASPDTPPTDPVARGKQLVMLTNCNGCHTPKNKDGSPMTDMMLAGAPLRGSEVAANITPDEATGIGKWTEDQIAEFLRTGKTPNGKQIEGAMAQQIQRRFSKLTEADAKAIAAFLKSIPAVNNEPKPAQ